MSFSYFKAFASLNAYLSSYLYERVFKSWLSYSFFLLILGIPLIKQVAKNRMDQDTIERSENKQSHAIVQNGSEKDSPIV